MIPVRLDWKAAIAGATFAALVVVAVSIVSASIVAADTPGDRMPTLAMRQDHAAAGWQPADSWQSNLVCEAGLQPLLIAAGVACAASAAMMVTIRRPWRS